MNYEALNMGGYGAYVWSSYALTLIALFVMAFAARRASQRELRTALRRMQVNAANSSITNASDGRASS